MEDSNQNNKYALVTGAAKGIGKSIALKFAENGINVAINYRKSHRIITFLIFLTFLVGFLLNRKNEF